MNGVACVPHSANGNGGQSGEFELEFVDIAPAPLLAGFQRFDNWMFRYMEMFCGVFVLRGIATTDVTATHAQAQVHPLIAGFQTFFASMCVWSHFLDL